jgi:serine/threonine-protein kinase
MRDLIGRTLGHYRIVDKIGEGGMGEVYRAHDERLDRDVAVKVLPAAVAEDAQRLARFEREAKLLASLSHQNVATLHGLEEHEGQRFLVMELADGETLAERIKRGPIVVDDALEIARQIAEGLEAAHEVGIIHRDLKPANVMVSPDGKVKVLDFGLAKAWQPEEIDADITHSPTLTAQMTAAGVLLGTAAYMSPEQARGKTADKRADIWAFGVMLFEMLTGVRMFEGETTSDVLAAVSRAEPDWSQLPPETPTPIRRLLHRCLDRDPRARLHDIADARLEIEEGIARPSWADTDQAERPVPTLRGKCRAAWPMLLAAAVFGVLLSAAVWWFAGNHLGVVRQPTRVTLNLPPGITADASIESGVRPQLAISPGGRWLVFVGAENGTPRLFKRSLQEFDAVPIPGTEGGFHPFFSPDGDWVGFFADDKLKKIPLNGGPPQVLADAWNPWGATWGPDGTIVYNRVEGDGLWRVSATGGAPEQLVSLEIERGDFFLIWPEFLPDGGAVLFTCLMGLTADIARIEVLDLESRSRKVLIENASHARYVPTGHLVFGRQGHAEVAPFDVARREITGPSVPVPESIFYEMESGALNLAFSADGALAFIPGGGIQTRQLLSVDLAGTETPLGDARRGFMYPTFSSDGERLAVTISEPRDTNVWVIDLATGAQTKITRQGFNAFPSWTPDGERVTYLSSRGGHESSIEWKRADGSGESEPLISTAEKGEALGPGSWSPDGETLVFFRYLPSQPEFFQIWVAPRDDDREPRPFGVTRTLGIGPAVSPDGEWLAYTSPESGQFEIYVQPFPDGGERYQISTDGGQKPVWSPDGRSIYYRALDERRILTAQITTKPRFRAGAPKVFLGRSYEAGTYSWRPNFDIAPDGKSFVFVKADEQWGRATEIRVVLNWFEELKRLAPTE